MTTLVFLLEELSIQTMLELILPRILPCDVQFQCIAFRGKQDMRKKLLPKIRGWHGETDSRFIVIQDQDSNDCIQLKADLRTLCDAAGNRPTLIRIVCHELETFYLGDLQAVESGLGVRNLARLQQTQKFRTPDQLNNAKQELRKLTDKYDPIIGTRAIAPHLRLDGSNASISFHHLISGIQRIASPHSPIRSQTDPAA